MNTWIAVPTYWTFENNEDGEELTQFDHPTPLNEEGTLARMLESFKNLKGDFTVIIVAACAHPDLGQRTKERVTEIVNPFRDDMDIFLVSPPDLSEINSLLSEPILSMDSYGNIRNVQLFVPYVMGADVVHGIDDDEIVYHTDLIEKIEKFIGKEYNGETVGGMAGPYFDKNEEYRIEGAEELGSHENMFIKKNYFMNEALKKVMTADCPEGIVKSNVAFGGNMCMHRNTIREVCHDPYSPRGEDYDYVINAALKGILFFFQPEMGITHLPPDSEGSQAGDKMSKLTADIKRFIYMRTKLTRVWKEYPDQKFDEQYILPYPGPYMDPDIDLREEAVAGIDEKYPEFRETGSPEDLVEEAQETAREKAGEFLDYRVKWCNVLGACEDNSELIKITQTLKI